MLFTEYLAANTDCFTPVIQAGRQFTDRFASYESSDFNKPITRHLKAQVTAISLTKDKKGTHHRSISKLAML